MGRLAPASKSFRAGLGEEQCFLTRLSVISIPESYVSARLPTTDMLTPRVVSSVLDYLNISLSVSSRGVYVDKVINDFCSEYRGDTQLDGSAVRIWLR